MAVRLKEWREWYEPTTRGGGHEHLMNNERKKMNQQLKWIITFGNNPGAENVEVWAFNIKEAIEIALKMRVDEPHRKMMTSAKLSEFREMRSE